MCPLRPSRAASRSASTHGHVGRTLVVCLLNGRVSPGILTPMLAGCALQVAVSLTHSAELPLVHRCTGGTIFPNAFLVANQSVRMNHRHIACGVELVRLVGAVEAEDLPPTQQHIQIVVKVMVESTGGASAALPHPHVVLIRQEVTEQLGPQRHISEQGGRGMPSERHRTGACLVYRLCGQVEILTTFIELIEESTEGHPYFAALTKLVKVIPPVLDIDKRITGPLSQIAVRPPLETLEFAAQ
mmetsp:Transcript_27278/g.68043  ORF Transcript_27278/g.68043 Transcript_27278/m.68043 type:complete len:243 (+) Transcript_27278:1823-2551(+)